MLRRHQLDRLAAEEPVSFERAAVEQHLAEAHVVRGGREQAAGRGEDFRRGGELLRAGEALVEGGRVDHGEAGLLFRRHGEASVDHAERLEDAIAQVGIERLAGNHLDHATDGLGGGAVFPLRAGLEVQRHARVRLHAIGEDRICGQLADRLGEQGAGGAAGRRHARAVDQQVMNRDAALGRHRDEAAGRVGLRHRDLGTAEFRQVFFHGVAEEHALLLQQHEQSDRRDRLGHRGEGEDVVGPHRPLALQVAVALRLEAHDLALSGHERDGAGDLALVLQPLDECADALQAFG